MVLLRLFGLIFNHRKIVVVLPWWQSHTPLRRDLLGNTWCVKQVTCLGGNAQKRRVAADAGCSKSLHHECLVCNFYLTTARTWSRTPTDGSRSFAARPKPHEPARWMEEKPSCAALRASQPSFAQVHFTQKLALHFLFQFFFRNNEDPKVQWEDIQYQFDFKNHFV